jgi:hypothetical protein
MILTVDTLAKFDDFTQTHGFAVLCREVRQNTGTKGDLLIQIAFREAIPTELQLRRMYIF